MGPHVVAVLKAGVSVVLDFPANTRANRAWMRTLFEAACAAHRLHCLNVADAVCRTRMHARQASLEHPFAVTDEQFDVMSGYFEAPRAEEGFTVVTYPA